MQVGSAVCLITLIAHLLRFILICVLLKILFAAQFVLLVAIRVCELVIKYLPASAWLSC